MIFDHSVNLHEEYLYAIENRILRLHASSRVVLRVIRRGAVVPSPV